MMNELIHDTTLYENIPSGEGRLPREMEVYKLLEQLNIPFKRMDHEPMATIEACQGVDKILGIHMCKNLFLCNKSKRPEAYSGLFALKAPKSRTLKAECCKNTQKNFNFILIIEKICNL